MKTLKDLFELVSMTIDQTNDFTSKTWFIRYSGHVNQLEVEFYLTGWSKENHSDKVSFKLDDDGIQGAYWFIKTRLN